MSADNCVAILATKIYPEAKEYQEWRVCVAHAIGNVFKNDYYMHQYFKNSPVFDVYEIALFVAQKLELDHGPTDMGIIIIKHPLGRTWDEIATRRSYIKKKSSNKRK